MRRQVIGGKAGGFMPQTWTQAQTGPRGMPRKCWVRLQSCICDDRVSIFKRFQNRQSRPRDAHAVPHPPGPVPPWGAMAAHRRCWHLWWAVGQARRLPYQPLAMRRPPRPSCASSGRIGCRPLPPATRPGNGADSRGTARLRSGGLAVEATWAKCSQCSHLDEAWQLSCLSGRSQPCYDRDGTCKGVDRRGS